MVGGERFQKELLAQLAAAQRSAAQQRLVALLGPACESYLHRLTDTDRSLARQVRELLALVREYGPNAVAAALSKAHAAGAFGADYIANLLRQQQVHRELQPPLRFQDPRLNELATERCHASSAVRILLPMADESIPDQLSDYFSRIGRKGGVARAKALTPEQRKASATKASKAAAKKRSLAAMKKRKQKK